MLKDEEISWHLFSSVQLLSRVWLFATPWITACQASLSITIAWRLMKLKSIESVMPSNPIILCHPLLLLPSVFPSIRAFSNESVLHIRWPKYWSFSFNIIPSNEYSGLISFRIYCLDLLAVQGTLKSLFQQHSSKASSVKNPTKSQSPESLLTKKGGNAYYDIAYIAAFHGPYARVYLKITGNRKGK